MPDREPLSLKPWQRSWLINLAKHGDAVTTSRTSYETAGTFVLNWRTAELFERLGLAVLDRAGARGSVARITDEGRAEAARLEARR